VSFVRRHPLLVGAGVVVVVCLAILSATAVAVWKAAHNDEARRHSHVDVIAVLGAAQYSGRPSLVFEARLRQAALLYHEGFATHVLVLGGGRPGDVTTEGDAGRQWLITQEQIPSEAVSTTSEGSSTLESMREAALFMRRQGWHSVFLVSDPWHNLRIRRMARDLGLEAFVSATGRSAARSQWTRLHGYTRETFAYLAYRILHR
jgi:uncharacterized SAM-binding protein YcdF (DUF218 family)